MPRLLRRSRIVGALALGAYAALLWWCSGAFVAGFGGTREHPRIVVYGFSVIGEVMCERIFPAFRERWRRERGVELDFVSSFVASGTVANQIRCGAPADVAILAHPDDADRIAAAGMARGRWRDQPHGGALNRTAVGIVVRPGNPLRIASFEDLACPGVRVVHPDPLTSGGAQWAILAEYGSRLVALRPTAKAAEAERAAYELLLGIWRNVVAQAPSARAAKTQFDTGFGDALVTYEVEALLDEAKGRRIEWIAPPATILTEHPVVVVERNIGSIEREAVDAFVAYLWSEEAQRAFVAYGFRSVLPGLDAENSRLRPIPLAFKVGALGGWGNARREIVQGIWRERVMREVRGETP